MTEILMPLAARIVLDAALRLKAGSLQAHQREPAFWGRARSPSKIILGDVEPREGWGNGEFYAYQRKAEVWALIDYRVEKCVAQFNLVTSVARRETDLPPGDDHQWSLNCAYYLCLKRNSDGSWKEAEEMVDFNMPASFLEY